MHPGNRRALSVRYVLPPLGRVPRDLASEGMSGLVGCGVHLARVQGRLGNRAELHGWCPDAGPRRFTLGDVAVRTSPGWGWARLPRLDARVAGPVLGLSARSPVADVAHAFSEPLLTLAPRARLRVLHYQNEVVASTRLQHWLLGRADLVVCCSDFIRRQALTRTRLAPERVVTVWNGVDLDAFQRDVGPEARARYGLRPDELMILFAGAVVPEKGLAHLLRALALLRDVPPWRLVVAGGASLWPTLDDPHPADDSAYAREVRALGADLPVSWLGNVPRATMPGLFVLADMFVCPSVWDDPFPTVNVEAMAGGTPIVASRVGGIPEAIEDGVTGALVPPGDPAPLADALRGLLTDPDRRRQQGIAARARAEHFSWDAAARRLDEAYRRLLLARRRR